MVAVLAFVFLSACGSDEFELGKQNFDKGYCPEAVQHLERAVKEGKKVAEAQKMIDECKVKIDEADAQACLDKAENYVEMLKNAKVVSAWEKIMEEFKQFKCRDVNPKTYIDRAYYNFIAYLAEWDAYPEAVIKYCEFTGCKFKEARILIREEEVELKSKDGKGGVKKEILQDEIPIADHERVMEMMKWLCEKDYKNARWFDRYAKAMWDTDRFAEALQAYEAISSLEKVGFELKNRAKVSADFLKANKRFNRPDAEWVKFFWIEEVKTKSKLKALKKDLEKAEKEKAAAAAAGSGAK